MFRKRLCLALTTTLVATCFASRAEPASIPSPPTTRAAVLADLGYAFTNGEPIGVLHSGSNCTASEDRVWTDLVKRRIEAVLPDAFEQEIAKVGPAFGSQTNGASPVRIQPFLNNLSVDLCQLQGSWQGSFTVQVTWDIVSADSNKVVYRASTTGSFKAEGGQRISTATALREAFAHAVHNLIGDARFAAILRAEQQRRVASAQ